MKNYKLSIEFSSHNDVTALAHAANVAEKLGGVVALIAPQKLIRVDETGTIVAIVKNKPVSDDQSTTRTSIPETNSLVGSKLPREAESVGGNGHGSDLRLNPSE